MTRFLIGLNRKIANVVELQHHMELEDMLYVAMKVERWLMSKGATRYSSGSNQSWKLKRDDNRDDGTISSSKIKPPRRTEKVSSMAISKRNQDIRCFRCLGLEQIASQFPTKRMILHDNGKVVSNSDGDEMPELEF